MHACGTSIHAAGPAMVSGMSLEIPAGFAEGPLLPPRSEVQMSACRWVTVPCFRMAPSFAAMVEQWVSPVWTYERDSRRPT